MLVGRGSRARRGRRTLLHRGWNQFGVTMLAAAAASPDLPWSSSRCFRLAGSHRHPARVGLSLSAVLFLIPGFAPGDRPRSTWPSSTSPRASLGSFYGL